MVYPKEANGNEVPLRILEGDKTQLAEVHGIALDTKNQLMYVVNQGPTSSNTADGGWARDLKPGASDRGMDPDGQRWKYLVPGSGKVMPPSITVYPLKATGDTAPVRVIQGPLTQLDWPVHISLDADRAGTLRGQLGRRTTSSSSAPPTTATWRPFALSRVPTPASASRTAFLWTPRTTSWSWPTSATIPPRFTRRDAIGDTASAANDSRRSGQHPRSDVRQYRDAVL